MTDLPRIADALVRCRRCAIDGPVGEMTMTDDELWDCDDTDACRIRTARERVAVTLGQALRDALRRHLGEHGCGTGDTKDPRYIGGFMHCAEGWHLFCLQPEGDQIIMAGR